MIRRRLAGCAAIVGFELVPAVLTLGWITAAILARTHDGWPHASDFHTFWVAAQTALHGGNPYPRAHDVAQWTTASQQTFVYPPAALALVVPLAYARYTVAAVVFLSLLTLAIIAGLRLLGVRDRRCYGVAFLWPFTLTSIGVGTLSPLLFLGLAAAWRWRDRRVVAAIAAACVVTAKLFLWPLIVWMWFTGRRASALLAVGVGVAVSATAWALIGFDGLRSYPAVLRTLSATEGRHSLSPLWLAGGGVLLPVAALAGVLVVGVASRRASERGAFCTAVVVALLVSPILWLHYLVLLGVVIALTRPRFGVVWVLPGLAWLTIGSPYGGGWRTAFATALIVVVWASSARDRIPPLRGGASRTFVPPVREAHGVLSLHDA